MSCITPFIHRYNSVVVSVPYFKLKISQRTIEIEDKVKLAIWGEGSKGNEKERKVYAKNSKNKPSNK